MTEDNATPCIDKIAYNSPEEARAAIASNSYFYKKPDLKVYKCKHCQTYHVTRNNSDD